VRLDFDFLLWVGSLVLSGAAVVLFLWLMREPKGARPEGEGGEPGVKPPTGV